MSRTAAPEPARAGARGPAADEETRALCVSIVVPVLNEAATIEAALARLHGAFPGTEVVVVDGGSSDGTPALVARPARLVVSRRGRGVQLNAGACAAGGQVLWFVHADTVIAGGALAQLRAALADPSVVGGGLTLAFDRRSLALDNLRRASNLRARHLGLVFGDQAMFVRRSTFTAVGGFPDIPLMEDLELSRRLRRRGRLVVLPATSTASTRRFDERGTWRTVLLMLVLKARYLAGADPEGLARRYSTASPPRRRRDWPSLPEHPHQEPAHERTR